MAKQFDYEVKTTIRLNMHNPDHVLINNVIQNLDPKILSPRTSLYWMHVSFTLTIMEVRLLLQRKKIMKGLNISGQQILRTLRQRL